MPSVALAPPSLPVAAYRLVLCPSLLARLESTICTEYCAEYYCTYSVLLLTSRTRRQSIFKVRTYRVDGRTPLRLRTPKLNLYGVLPPFPAQAQPIHLSARCVRSGAQFLGVQEYIVHYHTLPPVDRRPSTRPSPLPTSTSNLSSYNLRPRRTRPFLQKTSILVVQGTSLRLYY